ncbi:hypothetical protein THIOSC15_60002 [uncultured Thiomicrorhabdus sp.]
MPCALFSIGFILCLTLSMLEYSLILPYKISKLDGQNNFIGFYWPSVLKTA